MAKKATANKADGTKGASDKHRVAVRLSPANLEALQDLATIGSFGGKYVTEVINFIITEYLKSETHTGDLQRLRTNTDARNALRIEIETKRRENEAAAIVNDDRTDSED